MTTTDTELVELTQKAEAGDRNAIRELRLRKLAQFSHDRLVGDLRPDANGRISTEKEK